MKNFGLMVTGRDMRAYFFGSSPMPCITYNPSGNWEDYLPQYENQTTRLGQETSGCTVWGSQNQIETFMKRVYQIEPNYSERFTYLNVPIDPKRGTDPQNTYEAIRTHGLVDESLLPMTDTLTEYLDTSEITDSLRARGQNWLVLHDFQHEWLWDTRPTDYIQVLKDALKTSPIGVSVTAWHEVNGEYVSGNAGNNHFCLLYKIDDEGHPWIFDSYDHTKKKLSKDHNMRRAKRIWINRLTRSSMRRHISILEVILKSFMKPDLLDVCESNFGKDASPSDIAPDEVGCAETVTTLLKQVYPQTPILTGTWTLWDYLRNPKNGYIAVTEPTPETIIICATLPNKPFPGHTGIFQSDMTIASNDSKTGRFLKNYTYQSWMDRYMTKGGYKVYLFKKG